MRITISIAALAAMAGVISAQDANCTLIVGDYAPANLNGKYQKCYTDEIYNRELVAAGANPNYEDIVTKACSSSPCSSSTLKSATDNYVKVCSASIDREAQASGYQLLQLGRNALEIFFAEPIRNIYCGRDPEWVPPPAPSPPTTPPAEPPLAPYCLAGDVANPALRFQTQLALYLTEGSLRSNHGPFYTGLDQTDVCSRCSQEAVNSTIVYLSKNLMPGITFYTPEFVQYWTKFVPDYNKYCKTSLAATTWPEGTLNQTVPNLPPVAPPTLTTGSPTGTATATPTKPAGSAISVRPSTAGLMAVVAAMAAFL